MKTVKQIINEASPLTRIANAEGYTDAQEVLAQKGIEFDFDIRSGYNVPSGVTKVLDEIVGVMDWKDRNRSANYAYLGELSNFDKSELRGVSLKKGERIFRYATENSAVTGMAPMIKVNVLKGRAYFLTEATSNGETDEINFETRGVKLQFLKLAPKYMRELNII